ncbi:MAG: thiopeptide-type bacteriocin biosynthesis protein [Acidobacteriota bacterium]
MSGRGEWQSVHVFFEGALYGAVADRMLTEWVGPWLEAHRRRGDLDGYFFVRYCDEGGNHLRVRFRGRRAPSLLGALGKEAAEHAAVLRTAEAPYEPETARYGGSARSLAICERHFCETSEIALALLAKIPPGERAGRLGKALLAQLVLVHGFGVDRRGASDLAAEFGSGYLRQRAPDPELQSRWLESYLLAYDRQSDRLGAYLEAAWQALESGESLTPELDAMRRGVRGHRIALEDLANSGELRTPGGEGDWRSCRRFLLLSKLHMLNNRLGVDLREECYLAVLLHKTLAAEEAARETPQNSREVSRQEA